ncbi:hypothetical protein N7457_001770 [Penicillium paradoxum]|uniref:uncharacterized protein n=1 Tax=Penicillium paradoxum TaxID=176176 RepID=UPI002548BCC8|nr:uncharacterized protein N7457_001770 [Penicillium paradoxum]KAJ5795171.1 hypothetical protein N7457_001770 [Penicillium paradoxum]
MMFIQSTVMAALMGLSMVNAHMVMTSPFPYSEDTLNNSPLAPDGSDFPCKLRENAFQAPAFETIIGIGESYPLTFKGSAIHGGGSCQVSLTTDLQPSKSSEWKVIKSFEGGCPANIEGNLAANPNALGASTFNFSIPDGISAGKYTLAWTWFNRIGNREMYMNCAPITVSGGASKRSPEELERRAANFPSMFVANINGCMTKENLDIRFPQAGDYVEYAGNPANLAQEGSEACTGAASFGGAGNTASSSSSSSDSGSSSASSSGSSGYDSAGAGAAGASGADSAGSDSAGAGSAGTSSAPAGSAPTLSVSVSVASAVPSNASADFEPAPTAAAPAPESSSESSVSESASEYGSTSGSSSNSSSESSASESDGEYGSTSVSSSSSSSGALTGACSTEGQWNCISGSSFQRCASGTWTVSQPMSTGTECNAGQSAELVVAASKKARHISSMRFRKRNIHGSHFS